jgi:hypothetical protein
MSDGESTKIANEQIAPHTGATYQSVDMTDQESRETTMRSVERAVDDGYPVPLRTDEGNRAHELLIIGHDNGRLQIYNPWGYTFWLSEDDFVAGDVNRIDADIPATPTAVRLPTQAAR